MSHTAEPTAETQTMPRDYAQAAFDATLAEVRKMVQACMQCGTCTGSCPNAFAMDLTPRRMWRLLLMDRVDEVLDSGTMFLCSSCYTCTLRCPRGLTLTRAIGGLKRLAALQPTPRHKRRGLFYRTFVDNVRRWGRVREMDLMTRYFLGMKNPLLPLEFSSLGMKLMRKGKLHGGGKEHKGVLDSMFNKVKEMEGPS